MAGMTTRRRQRAQRLDEDDGPVMIERRRSRHGNYYPEIPPEPEPTPVPVQPEPVPELPVWGEYQPALDYIKGLESALPYLATAVYVPPVTITSNNGNWTSGYSISLNDVIGSYKGGMLSGSGYDPTHQVVTAATKAALKVADDAAWNRLATGYAVVLPDTGVDAKTKECGHTYYDPVGKAKFKYHKDGDSHGGKSIQTVKCQNCGHEWVEETLF